jgi:hypothetical protein
VQARKRNNRNRMRKVLQQAFAEENEWDIRERLYLGLAQSAIIDGDWRAQVRVLEILRDGEL